MSDRPPPGDRARRQLSLFDGPAAERAPAPAPAAEPADADAAARAFAVDPRHNVVLEASAGTGKTSVLVARYINLLRAGVDPANILAITFTRKAAAEMHERIVRELRGAAERSALDKARWQELRDRLNEIAISTIDAFCLSLLREFPLEADVDPAFDLADETEVPRLTAASLDRTLRLLIGLARTDPDVRLVLAQLGISRTREGLATLLDRRLVAWDALDRFLVRGPRNLTAEGVCRTASAALLDTLRTVAGGLPQFLADGPGRHPRYQLFLREVSLLSSPESEPASDAAVRAMLDRIASHFLTNEGKARKAGAIPPYRAEHYPGKDAARRHRDALFDLAPRVEQVMFAFNRDLNAVMARGVRRMFAVALEQYRRALDERSVLDFSDVLQRALQLLRQMDEFSQSRYRLESRFHHVLVDEFQDTSRAQWELVSLLVKAWGEGMGLAASPSIFIVGDRKQSIYRFRDAEVAVLNQAARHIDALRPGGRARQAISRSFRARPALLHFVNDLFSEISQPLRTAGEFTYEDKDRFPVDASPSADALRSEPALGVAVADTPEACAATVADEIGRLLREASVRDKRTGLPRPARPGDIGILFRSRTSHREFERELGNRRIPTYVYKGLGFFDADEIKDLTALLRYLAEPTSNLRAAAFMRSRFVRLSDRGIAALAPDLSAALLLPASDTAALDDEDRRVLTSARGAVARWLGEVDRATPAELLDRILAETAYAYELSGPRQQQAWENVKKMRGLLRRIQNRGYATVSRIADHLDSLTAGDESNAVIEALDAVNLMTVHAAKGLEFPIVFVVNLTKGASGPPRPVRVVLQTGPDGQDEASVSVGPFVSDTDEAEREQERHETRRLLYVALTRARDRLYLASALKDGMFAPGRGSLAEVLPDSFKAFFERASAAFAELDSVGWTGVSGAEYVWRLCRPAAEETVGPAAAPDATHDGSPQASHDDFEPPAVERGLARVAAGESIGAAEDAEEEPLPGRSERLLGVLIHRLFAAGEAGRPIDASAAQALALELLRPEEMAVADDPDALTLRAARAWVAARGREDVIAALSGDERLYEVPFSMRVSGEEEDAVQVVRGFIDCVVRQADGRLTVVEFKSGRPRGAHQRQLELYVRAARSLLAGQGNAAGATGGERVRGVLVYV